MRPDHDPTFLRRSVDHASHFALPCPPLLVATGGRAVRRGVIGGPVDGDRQRASTARGISSSAPAATCSWPRPARGGTRLLLHRRRRARVHGRQRRGDQDRHAGSPVADRHGPRLLRERPRQRERDRPARHRGPAPRHRARDQRRSDRPARQQRADRPRGRSPREERYANLFGRVLADRSASAAGVGRRHLGVRARRQPGRRGSRRRRQPGRRRGRRPAPDRAATPAATRSTRSRSAAARTWPCSRSARTCRRRSAARRTCRRCRPRSRSAPTASTTSASSPASRSRSAARTSTASARDGGTPVVRVRRLHGDHGPGVRQGRHAVRARDRPRRPVRPRPVDRGRDLRDLAQRRSGGGFPCAPENCRSPAASRSARTAST